MLDPFVKRGVLAQPEAIEEGTAHQGEGVLHLGDQGTALRLRGERGDPPGLLVGLLHHVQVQFEGGMRVQAVRAAWGSLSGHRKAASLLRESMPPSTTR